MSYFVTFKIKLILIVFWYNLADTNHHVGHFFVQWQCPYMSLCDYSIINDQTLKQCSLLFEMCIQWIVRHRFNASYLTAHCAGFSQLNWHTYNQNNCSTFVQPSRCLSDWQLLLTGHTSLDCHTNVFCETVGLCENSKKLKCYLKKKCSQAMDIQK